MKICPNCSEIYKDDGLNFCLNDGSMLAPYSGDEPRTIYMDRSRTTNSNWPGSTTAAGNQGPWSGPQGMEPYQNAPVMNPNAGYQVRNTTLPTISLILGIAGLILVCCHGGIPLGAGAIITGAIAINQEKTKPDLHGGRGLAIGGVITGAIAVAVGLGFILLAIFSSLN